MGRLIPAGTGLPTYNRVEVAAEAPPPGDEGEKGELAEASAAAGD
jgi:hypothetical protein